MQVFERLQGCIPLGFCGHGTEVSFLLFLLEVLEVFLLIEVEFLLLEVVEVFFLLFTSWLKSHLLWETFPDVPR